MLGMLRAGTGVPRLLQQQSELAADAAWGMKASSGLD